MRFSIGRERFYDALRTVSRAVSVRTVIPALSGICLTARDGALLLRATNLELSVHRTVPADVAEAGSIVLPGRHLTELVHRLPRGEISVRADSSHAAARLSHAESEWVIHGFSADQFPSDDAEPEGPPIRVDRTTLRTVLRETGFAAGQDESRPWSTGIFLQVAAGRLTAMATNSAVVAYGEAPLADAAAGDASFSAIVPGRSLAELGALLPDPGEAACIVTPLHNRLRFDLGETTLVTRLLEGHYPDFRTVLPSAYASSVSMDRVQLLEACERAVLLAREGAVRLEGEAGALRLTARSPEVGHVAERLPAILTGPAFAIPLNVRYLLDGLKAMESFTVQVEFHSARSAVRFRAGPAAPSYFAVMPLLSY